MLDKLYILCSKQMKLLKSISQYNEFNADIMLNVHYTYEFKKTKTLISDARAALSNLSIYYMWKNYRKTVNVNNLKNH